MSISSSADIALFPAIWWVLPGLNVLILTPTIKRLSLVFAILFVFDMHYSLILLSNNASTDAEQPFLPIYESKQN